MNNIEEIINILLKYDKTPKTFIDYIGVELTVTPQNKRIIII